MIVGIVALSLIILLASVLRIMWRRIRGEEYFVYIVLRLGEGNVCSERIRILGDYDYALEVQESILFKHIERISKKYPSSGVTYSEAPSDRVKTIALKEDPEVMFVVSKIEKGS